MNDTKENVMKVTRKVSTMLTVPADLAGNYGKPIILELPYPDPYESQIVEDLALWLPREGVLCYAIHDDNPPDFEWGADYWSGCELDPFDDQACHSPLKDNEYWVSVNYNGTEYKLSEHPTGIILRCFADDVADVIKHIETVLEEYSNCCNGEVYRIVTAHYDLSSSSIFSIHDCWDSEPPTEVIGYENVHDAIIEAAAEAASR
jgi:hypothetical protein